jgi:1,4-alpha-glucan branching enzyme
VSVGHADIAPFWHLNRETAELLTQARLSDPFSVLGRHPIPDGWVIRAFVPGGKSVDVFDRQSGRPLGTLDRGAVDGLFEGKVANESPYLLRIRWAAGVQAPRTLMPSAFCWASSICTFSTKEDISTWRVHSVRSQPL